MSDSTKKKNLHCFSQSFLWTLGVVVLSTIVYFGVFILSIIYPKIDFSFMNGPFTSKNLILISIALISSVFIEYLFSNYKIENKFAQFLVSIFVFGNYALGVVAILGDDYKIFFDEKMTRILSFLLLSMTVLYSIGIRFMMFRKNSNI